jgi:biotin carboxyl carrier protein
MIYEVTIGEGTRTVRVERGDGGYRIQVDDAPAELVRVRRLQEVLHLLVGDRSLDCGVVRSEQGWDVTLLGTLHEAQVVDPRRKALRMAAGAGQGLLKSSMPGRVVSLLAEVGQQVEKGEPILVLEAMKMENEVKAPMSGTVAEFFVDAGQAVDAGGQLARIE